MSAQRPLERSEVPAIHGHVASGLELVRDVFTSNFTRSDERREIGAALTVYRGETCVVDLWGGSVDRARTREWQRDTLVNAYSTTKGIVAACVAILVERGLLRYEDRVARYWPEFAANGKSDATISHVMSHQVGLPAFEDPVSLEDLYDWPGRCKALAAQAPRWRPGEKTAYHPITYGYLAGEIIRRVAGQSIGQFLARELSEPLGSDVFIGLPEPLHSRVAELVPPTQMVDPSLVPLPEEARLAITNPALQPAWANTRAWRCAEMPALNGHASAHGIARLYALLANEGTLGRSKLLSSDTLKKMTHAQPRRMDLMLGMEVAWAHGMAINGTLGFFGPAPQVYGHSGWGGSFGCADAERRLAIGYVCNQMGPDLVGDLRGREICKAVYSSL
jgi:CubicO group peptidase (beta-lactamase class C family)